VDSPPRKSRFDWVDLRSVIPDAVIDLRYSGSRNLFGRPVYPVNAAFLRAPVAARLARAAWLLRPAGLRLMVWDAYRPLSVQKAMWDACPDPDFVAHPRRGSRHNRGAAVDVTLSDWRGLPIAMPTDFDDFSPRAWWNATDAPPGAIRHREILRRAMLAAGFTGIRHEWWHFDDPMWRNYPLADVPLTGLGAPGRQPVR
jgi:zinc D-Ala-D-Ala dipeptidase